MNIMGRVREFHHVFRTPQTGALRALLIAEEAGEVGRAIDSGDRHRIAQELADLVYVAYGTALTYNIDLDRAIKEVHKSNMTKIGPHGRPVVREDGKVLKGPGYREPDMSRAVL